MNTNNNNPKTYKQFSEQALAIYNLVAQLIDKYGIMAVDWMGYTLGLNKHGKPVSKQSADELLVQFKQLAEELKKPEVREAMMDTIKEAEPILKEGLFTMLTVAVSGIEFALKDGLTFICSDTPAAPICGLFKFAANGIEFGDQLLNGARGSVKTVQETQSVGQNLQNRLNNLRNSTMNPNPNMNPNMNTNPNLNTNTNVSPSIKGGAKTLKKIKREKRKIEKRIRHSLHEFIQGTKKKPKSKTRRRRSL